MYSVNRQKSSLTSPCLLAGYIGGSVVSRLLEHPNASNFEITALVRSPEKAAKMESLGIKTFVGSLSELDKLEKLSSEADVLISTVGIFQLRQCSCIDD